MNPARFVPLLGAVCLAALAPPLSADVARFDTAEIVLHAARGFDGAQGLPNPFDVELTADVVAPSGRHFVVEGFFDGDGEGGMAGNVFKLRIAAEETGTWSWTAHSSDPGLDGRKGSFGCSGSLAGRFQGGPLEVNPEFPATFRQRNGTPVYLLGNFLDRGAPDPLKFSHTFFSEALTDADRRAFLDRQLGQGVNKINIYLANKGDYKGLWPTTPWVGTAAANDRTRFDLARWHLWERWLAELRRAGLFAQLWFFADDSNFGALPEADRRRLIRYGMARLSASVNTLFILCLEWQEGWSPAEVASFMAELQQRNPWHRLASVHGQTGDFAFPTAPWADFLDIQAGGTGYAGVHERGLFNRTLAAKPVLQEEMGEGVDGIAMRQKSWAAFTAGAAGAGNGGGLAQLAALLGRVPFERMVPLDRLVVAGAAYALAEPGSSYVFYQPASGGMTVDLSAATGMLTAEWYNPRTGEWLAAAPVAGGGKVSFRSPQATGDWALYLHRIKGPLTAPTGCWR